MTSYFYTYLVKLKSDTIRYTKCVAWILFLTICIIPTLNAKENLEKDKIENLNDKTTITPLDSLQKYGIFLNEIVINSIKHNRNLHLAPMSATAFNANDLKSQQINDLKGLSQIVPNLYAPDYGTVLTSPVYIRGIGSKLGAPSVGLYVDGVPYFEKSAFALSFTDIASIQVLRGPQGTLYGRNTMGGVIDITTSSPMQRQGNSLGFLLGEYGQVQATASVSQKLSDRIGLAVSGVYNSYDGYFKNTLKDQSADNRKNGAGRMKLIWNINDNWNMQLTQLCDYTSQKGYPYSPYNTKENALAPIENNGDSNYRRLLSASGLRLRYNSEKLQFTSQSSFHFIEDHNGIDQDFTKETKYYVTQDITKRTLSQEFTAKYQLNSHYSSLVGMYLFSEEMNQNSDLSIFRAKMTSIAHRNLPSKGISLYHQSKWTNFLPNWNFIAGIRYDFEDANLNYHSWRKMDNSPDSKETANDKPKKTFNQWSPKVVLQYQLPNKQQIYASITRGYQTGGFNTTFDSKENMSYDAEYSWNYELGLRMHTADKKYSGELTFFYIDWKNQQVYKSIKNGRMLLNAGKSHSKGIEFSLLANPIKSLELELNLGYTEAKFDQYKNKNVDYKGNYLPLVPKETISLHGNYNWNKPTKWIDHLIFSANYSGTGDLCWTVNNNVSRQYYGTINAQIRAAVGPVTVSLWGKNITNKKYTAYYFEAFGSGFGQYGKPARFGTSVNIYF